MADPTHNPDLYMVELRQILAQGRKRIGILVGAGAPLSIKVNPDTGEPDINGNPIIPDVAGLTDQVINSLGDANRAVVATIQEELGAAANIEAILSRIRSLADILGDNKIGDYDGTKYGQLADVICESIASKVSVNLPKGSNPYIELGAWISGTDRVHPIEIFTPNYDLLLEEAFERLRIPFFDGFSGACEPFFDPASVFNNDLPPRWPRIWKIHGSIGWEIGDNGTVVRTGDRSAAALIYPEDRKYDQTQKLPYTALFDRLRQFLSTPDTLLLTCGFSFCDAHISAVIEEALAANPAASTFACQFGAIENSPAATEIALRRPNLSLYCSDSAVINCVLGTWRLGEQPNKYWKPVRSTFWESAGGDNPSRFLLGSFEHFSRFFALSKSTQLQEQQILKQAPDEEENGAK